MARINISLPDDLHRDVEEVRRRLNVSAVCQRALRQELARLKPTDADVQPSDEVIERLRGEKEELETTSKKRGFDVGLEWANRASFAQLRRWGEYVARADQLATLETPPLELEDWLWESDDLMGGPSDAKRLVEKFPEYRHLPILYSDPWNGIEFFHFDFGDRSFFNAGFLDAVSKFWQTAKARL